MTKTGKAKRSPLKVVTIIVAVIVVVLYMAVAFEIRTTAQGYVYDYDSRDYIHDVERDRFGQLYETSMRDMSREADYSAEVAEYRALAFYYEQAVLEHAYRVAGDDAQADAFAQRMEEYEEQLGSVASKAEAVREAVSRERSAS